MTGTLDTLTNRIRKTEPVVIYLKPIQQGMTEAELADLLWKTCSVNIPPELISIRQPKHGGAAGALILIPRDVIANWLSLGISAATGIEVSPAHSANHRENERTRSKVLTNRNGITRLVRMEGR